MTTQSHVQSQLAISLANIDRGAVAKNIDAGKWQSTSIDDVRDAANEALKGSGLVLLIPKLQCHISELAGHILVKVQVDGFIEYGHTGERRQIYGEAAARAGGKQPLEQLVGALYSYAAKNAIVSTLNLPRGGDDGVEYAHKGAA